MMKYAIRTVEQKLDYCFELLWGKRFPDAMHLTLEQNRNEYANVKRRYGDEAAARVERLYSNCILLNIERLRQVQREKSYTKRFAGFQVIHGGPGIRVDYKALAAGDGYEK